MFVFCVCVVVSLLSVVSCVNNNLFTVRRQFYNVIVNEKTLLLKFSNAREPPTTHDEETKNAMFNVLLLHFLTLNSENCSVQFDCSCTLWYHTVQNNLTIMLMILLDLLDIFI